MSKKDEAILKDIVDGIQAASKQQTTPYDTTAEVTRVDGNTAYAHIPGGVDETPVTLTQNAKPGDNVQVRVSGGRAWIVGNATAPPTDDTKANAAYNQATTAADAAASAVESATTAQDAAGRASSAASRAEGKADDAADAASAAQASASNASEYAARALGNLASVESVAETISWITAHGTMALTQDQQLDPTHVYFIQDNNGDYTVGGTRYSIVTEPDAADLSTYYELSINQSLNNYVATHLAVDGEGLWLLPDAGGNKVLIATGAGSTYTTAGTYIIGKVNNTDTVFAKFASDGATMTAENGTLIAHLGYGQTQGESSTGDAPYYTFGTRANNSTNGAQSVAEGRNATASGAYSHAEGKQCTASGQASHAEGSRSTASGLFSHAGGYYTKAQGDYQTVIGKYNYNLTTTLFEVGNGTGDALSDRSNALTVYANGDLSAAGGIMDGNGNVLADKADATAIPTVNNATLTIQKNGTNVQTFTANASTDKTANITVPTATSDLTNDSGFITNTGLFKVVTVSKTISSLNAHTNNNIGTLTVSSSSRPSGMTLVGVVGYNCTNYRVSEYKAQKNGDHSIEAGVTNTTATNISSSFTCTWYLLYINGTSA